jgi:hypothetical protein
VELKEFSPLKPPIRKETAESGSQSGAVCTATDGAIARHQAVIWGGQVLRKKQCACGRGKKEGQAFCKHCYLILPEEMQTSLWRRISEGFWEAYSAAVAWMRQGDD